MVRGSLVAVGIVFAGVSIRALVALQSTSSGGDGFLTGGAYLLWGALVVLSLGAAGLGVALPSVFGGDDSLGFGRQQRRVLRIAGSTLVLGALAGAAGVFLNSFFGILSSLLVLLLGVLGVCTALVWRLGEALRRRIGRPDGG